MPSLLKKIRTFFSSHRHVTPANTQTIKNDLISAMNGASEPSPENWQRWFRRLGATAIKEILIENDMIGTDYRQQSFTHRKNEPIVFILITRQWIRSLNFFINHDLISFNERTICNTYPQLNNQTLLMRACEINNKNIVEYFLSKTPINDLEFTDSDKKNVFFYVKSPVIFELILSKIDDKNWLVEHRCLMQRSEKNDRSCLEKYIHLVSALPTAF
jgi:hypothetical protein